MKRAEGVPNVVPNNSAVRIKLGKDTVAFERQSLAWRTAAWHFNMAVSDGVEPGSL